MISAMPAVAVRRERKKSKSQRGGGKVSKHASLSTISSTGAQTSYGSRIREFYRRDKQRLRILVYTGTVLMGSGLILVFIGVGTSASAFQTVGLLFIGLGSLLCLIKIFCGHTSNNERDTAKRIETSAVESHNVSVTMAVAGSEYPVMMVQTIPMAALKETDVGSHRTENSSPTAMVPEMQIVITDKPKERY